MTGAVEVDGEGSCSVDAVRVGEKEGEKTGVVVEAGEEVVEGFERRVSDLCTPLDRKKLFLLLTEACEL